MKITMLPIGGTIHYELQLVNALRQIGIEIDIVGNEIAAKHPLCNQPGIHFINIRAVHDPGTSPFIKALKLIVFYIRLMIYALFTKTKIFHIQWENKLHFFDRTVLILYYKILGKRIVWTAHNINGEERDNVDTVSNRISLKILYALVDKIIVHTNKMKKELIEQYFVSSEKISVISMGIITPFIRNHITPAEARKQLGIDITRKVLLFFGGILHYKGVDILIDSFEMLLKEDPEYLLVVAGNPRGTSDYVQSIRKDLGHKAISDHVIEKIEYIAEEDIEKYFLAADCLVMPYRKIFQSAVLFMALGFGLPVLATDIGSFRDYVKDGRTGFLIASPDSQAVTDAIRTYYQSNLFVNLEIKRPIIRRWTRMNYSWTKVAKETKALYDSLV